MIVASAPGRCGVVGNPTDMYGGSVVSLSTQERAYCTLEESDRLTLCTEIRDEVSCATDLQLKGDHLDIIRGVLLHLRVDPASFPYTVSARTDLPEQAGLAGSTAIVTAVLGGVLHALGVDMSRHLVAETARLVEYRVMGVMCGYQDQYMAAFGGLNYIDFRGKERLAQDHEEPLATVEPLAEAVGELPVVVAHTGISRNSGYLHRSLRERWLEGEEAVLEGYERIAQLARLGKKSVLARDWEALGQFMDENHAIQRDLGGSGPQNDFLIDVAKANGALAAKLAGAGRGGTIIALTLEPERTAAALTEAGAERLMWPRPEDGLTVEERNG